jgi:hypothetical protein
MKLTVRQPQPPPTDLVERTGPEIFRFESSGDCLRGHLLNVETAEIGGKPTLKYIVRDEKDERKLFSFLGTVDLNQKIRSSDVGKILEVQYVGRDAETEDGKNAIKRFKVFVQKDN